MTHEKGDAFSGSASTAPCKKLDQTLVSDSRLKVGIEQLHPQ